MKTNTEKVAYELYLFEKIALLKIIFLTRYFDLFLRKLVIMIKNLLEIKNFLIL